jgi:lysophospholipase
VQAILHPTDENPSPPGAECITLVTSDKVHLRAMKAVPENARGTVVILGGRGDFIERYFETARDLIDRGFAVAMLDMRGQGGSQRPKRQPFRDRTRSFAGFDEDVRTLMDDLVIRSCPGPYYALGHSTGAHVLLRLLRKNKWFARGRGRLRGCCSTPCGSPGLQTSSCRVSGNSRWAGPTFPAIR